VGLLDLTLRPNETLAGPVLAYGIEAWVIRKSNEKRLSALGIKYRRMRTTPGYTLLDRKRNDENL
jgi:hypothetical protein